MSILVVNGVHHQHESIRDSNPNMEVMLREIAKLREENKRLYAELVERKRRRVELEGEQVRSC